MVTLRLIRPGSFPAATQIKVTRDFPITTTVMAVIPEALQCPDLLFAKQPPCLVFWQSD